MKSKKFESSEVKTITEIINNYLLKDIRGYI